PADDHSRRALAHADRRGREPGRRRRQRGGRGGAVGRAGQQAAGGIVSGPPPPVVIPNFGGASKCVTNNDLFCTDWVQHNWGSTLQPALLDHVKLTVIAVAIGFVIAFAAAVVARRLRFVEHPFTLFGALLYTIPSIALFQLLVPFTGLTETTVEIALIGYTLLILFRNTLAGFQAVPEDALEAAVG